MTGYRRLLEERVRARTARRREWHALHRGRRLESWMGAPLPDAWFAGPAWNALGLDFARALTPLVRSLARSYARLAVAAGAAAEAQRRLHAPLERDHRLHRLAEDVARHRSMTLEEGRSAVLDARRAGPREG